MLICKIGMQAIVIEKVSDIMKIKLLYLALLLFLLTGCDVSYNLTIFDGDFKEKLTVNGVNVTESNKELILPLNYENDDYSLENVKPGDDGFYDLKIKDNGYSLFHNFNYDDFVKSTILNSCYQDIDVKKLDNNIYISTTGKFKCFDYYDNIETVKVKINSSYKLVASNADSVDGSNYIWNINRNNLDKGIYIELDTSFSNKTSKNWLSNNWFLVFIFQFILLLILVGIIIFIKKKNDEDEMF